MNFNDNEPPSVESFEADRVYLYVQQELSDYAAISNHATVEDIKHHTINGMILRIKTWCLSGRIDDSSTSVGYEYPDGVWQMFKEKYMPHWFVKRFPVRMHTVNVTTTRSFYFVCPHLDVHSQSKHIQFMATGTPLAGRIRT